MKYGKSFPLALSLCLLFSSKAFAFNFGFVRVPDWMDSYIVTLMCGTLFCYFGLLVTKPRGVPLNQLYQTKISPLANLFRFLMLILVVLLMLMVFAGMGLRRYAEA